jgi:acyl-lipid omega-6 desaturase (Delta-12 desaturase)
MSSNDIPRLSKQERASIVAKYQTPDTRTATWQIITSFGPFLLLWYLAYRSLAYSYWITLVLAVLAGGFLMRIFIIQHDCGHGSFFKSTKANDIVGSVFGVLTLTPYYYWRRNHSIHHATVGNLDRRGVGDVYTMTVNEYIHGSRWERFKYRFFRYPLVLLGLGPMFMFVLVQRFPLGMPKSFKRERYSVYWTDLAAAAIVAVMGLTIGLRAFLLVHLPAMLLAATVEVWMFYIQHQFADTYWARNNQWDFIEAAMQGSSYYKLPRVLEWFTGNIGLHHIHHLGPSIPNYRLQKCYDENPILHKPALTFWPSLKNIFLGLWDEEHQRLVSFGSLKSIRPQAN